MSTILTTPYPKSTVFKFTKFLAVISLMVTFILVVFQPYGTASFSHVYKYLILAGYGIVIFMSGLVFFIFINLLVSDSVKDRWTVGYEVGLLLLTVLISQLACFYYWVWLFDASISFKTFISFLIVAMSVSILPVGFYLLYIYQKYRDVQHAISSADIASKQGELKAEFFDHDAKHVEPDDGNFTIAGTGKREKYVFQSKNLILIVAEDNYIIVHSLENQKLKKWMIRATMNEIENQLNTDFIRIHRSYIINKNYIDQITGNVTNTRLKLQSIDGEYPVSRGKVAVIRQLQ